MASSSSCVLFAVMEQFSFWSLAAFPICSGWVGMQMLGFAYFMVSKHVRCPPLKMTSSAFLRASSRSFVESHECMWQLPFLMLTFLLGIPRLIMLFVSSFSSTGSMVWVSLARVPYGPLMGAKTCSALPCV